MYEFISFLPIVFLILIICSLIFFVASLVHDSSILAIVFTVLSLVLVFPLFMSMDYLQSNSEAELYVVDRGNIIKKYKAHDIRYHDDYYTFLDKYGNSYIEFTTDNKNVHVGESHEYNGNN